MSEDGYTRTINFLTPIGFEKAPERMGCFLPVLVKSSIQSGRILVKMDSIQARI